MHYNGSKFKQKCDASVCHMTGSAFIRDIHEQTCNGGVKRCDAQCNVSAGTCKQHCDAELCKLECSGKDCDQKCNGGTKQCIMHYDLFPNSCQLLIYEIEFRQATGRSNLKL